MSLTKPPAASSIVVRAAAEPSPTAPAFADAPAFALDSFELQGHKAAATCLSFVSDGAYLLTGSADRQALLWDLRDEDLPAVLVLTGARAAITSLAVQPALVAAALATADGDVLLHDLSTGERTVRLRAISKAASNDVAAVDEHCLLVAGNDARLRLWDVRARRSPSASVELPCPVTAVAGLGGHRAVSGALDGRVRLHDLRRLSSSSSPETLASHEGHVAGTSARPDGGLLATVGGDGVRVTDARPFAGGGDRARAVCAGADVRFEPRRVRPAWGGEHCVAVGGADGVVRLWDARDGTLLSTHSARAGAVNDVAFHPEMDVVAAAADDCMVRIGPAGVGVDGL